MAEQRRQRLGIRSKHFKAINAMPTDYSLEKAYEETGLDGGLIPPPRNPWRFMWHIGSERIVFNPGDSYTLREDEAKAFENECRERGGLVVSEDASELEIMEATRRLWQERRAHYQEFGRNHVKDLMRKAQPTPRHYREIDEYLFDYWPYIVNQHMADFLNEKIKVLTKKINAAKARDAKAAAKEASE